jgi:hypothetical protein
MPCALGDRRRSQKSIMSGQERKGRPRRERKSSRGIEMDLEEAFIPGVPGCSQARPDVVMATSAMRIHGDDRKPDRHRLGHRHRHRLGRSILLPSWRRNQKTRHSRSKTVGFRDKVKGLEDEAVVYSLVWRVQPLWSISDEASQNTFPQNGQTISEL